MTISTSRISNANELRQQPVTAEVQKDARRVLVEMKNNLIDERGRISSGYLRLTDTGDMNAGYALFTRGNATHAKDSVRELLKQAYGGHLDKAGEKKLDKAINRYLQRSGGKIGTRSFVKLVQALEKALPTDDGQSPQKNAAEADIDSRLSLPEEMELALASKTVTVVQLTESAKSPIGQPAQTQFGQLLDLMREDPSKKKAFGHFRRLMFPGVSKLNPPESVKGPDAPRTFVMGDADGSMARMVLHAIASGVVELPRENMPALARVMQKEAEVDSLKSFQEDQQVSQDLDEIATALTVKQNRQDGQDGKPVCVYMGDILSDRFTNNQQALATFIRKLSTGNTGVCFIAGNHDTQPLLDPRGLGVYDAYKKSKSGSQLAEQRGAYAAKKMSFQEYQGVLKCFKAANYSDGVLFTHNGVKKAWGRNVHNQYNVGICSEIEASRMRTVVIEKGTWTEEIPVAEQQNQENEKKVRVESVLIKADSPEQLAEKMNDMFKTSVEKNAVFNELISTGFRPQDSEMTPAALGFTATPNFRQVHGHEANANEDHPGVTNLNARSRDRFTPVGTVIEYPPAAARRDQPPAQQGLLEA